jgi:transcription antitermination factor NusG
MEISTHHDESSWYAVSTRSRQEKVAASMLENLAIVHFLPLFNEERRWSDRKQMVALPLFPGYVFVKITIDPELQLRVLKVPGIVDFVGNRNVPLAIPESDIESVRAVVTRGVRCSPHPSLKAGCRVRVVRGVLAGVEGTLIRSGADSKLVICVEMIQRSVSVSVDVSDVEPVYREPRWQVQSPSAPLTPAADHAQSRGTSVFQSNS